MKEKKVEMAINTSALTLRQRIQEDPSYQALFDQAEKLAKSKFDFSKSGRMMIPFFTDHTISHMGSVEKLLDEIIFDSKKDDRTFDPTPAEAAFLLSSVCGLVA